MYKTAEELKITQLEYDALLRTKDLLGKTIKFDEEAEFTINEKGNTGARLFNMSVAAQGGTKEDYAGKEFKCGTAACIGGWNYLLSHGILNRKGTYDNETVREAEDYVVESEGSLRNLYYPPTSYDYDLITDAQAVQAIENFLTYGKPKWKDVLGKVSEHHKRYLNP